MKKILAIVLAMVMVLCLASLTSFAEATNVALGKTATADMTINGPSDVPNMGIGFWDVSYLFDGKVPIFTSSDVKELGWYASSGTPEVDIEVVIDLDGTYDVSEIRLLPQGFIGGLTFPGAYEVYISCDAMEWEKVGENAGTHAGQYMFETYEAGSMKAEHYQGMLVDSYTFGPKVAQWVKIHVTQAVAAGDGKYYAGLGEVEVMGVEHQESIGGGSEPRDFDFGLDTGEAFDWILVNGQELANGNDAVIAAKKGIDGTNGDIQTIGVYGWYGNTEAIEAFGYRIDGQEIVFNPEFITDTDDAVKNNGGDNARRFLITFDVSNLEGEGHVIWAYAKLATGAVVKLNRYDNRGTGTNEKDREVYVIYNGPAASQGGQQQGGQQGGQNPGTADASMVIFVVAAAAIALIILKKKVF